MQPYFSKQNLINKDHVALLMILDGKNKIILQ